MDDAYYGAHGEQETSSQAFAGEYRLMVMSFDNVNGRKVADWASRVKLVKTFTERADINRAWAMLKAGTTFNAMRAMGFERMN